MNVIVYSSGCLPCTNKPLWKQLRAKAAEKRVLLDRKDVSKDKQARDEANLKYGLAVPFIVDENGVAMGAEAWLA